jgi:hypothetical protein
MTSPKRRQVVLGGAAALCVAGAFPMAGVARRGFLLALLAEVLMAEVSAAQPTSRSFVVSTDAGMLAVWNPKQFTSIVDYDSWERELLEDKDILRRVRAGHLVPINFGRDFTAAVTVRIEPLANPRLSEREARYAFFASDPYLYVSDGELCLTGLEGIERDPSPASVMAIAPGRYQVTIHILDWDLEPGAKDESGRPTANALPDYLVLVSPESAPDFAYRTELETFDREKLRRELLKPAGQHPIDP